MADPRQGVLMNYLTLFTSLGTLLCCALPTLLVFLGLGATVASIVSSAPWLVTVSQHKALVFTIAGGLIALNFLYSYRIAPSLRSSAPACPIDGPGGCDSATRASRFILWFSAVLYASGVFAAYVLPLVIERFG